MKIAVIGGHMAPAVGFIAALPKNVEVVYIGRKNVFEGDKGLSLEYESITKQGIRFVPLTTGRVQRVLTRQTIPSLLKVPKGFLQAFALLKKEKPDIVIGFGGYLSVPIGAAAKIRNIPFVVHESTLGAGLANKLLAPLANKIFISWDSSRAFFPKNKTVLTGNPFLPSNSDVKNIPFPLSKEKLPLLVVTGGSGGSHVINTSILHILPELLEKTKVLHITGDAAEYGDFQLLSEKRKTLSKTLQQRYSVTKFVDPNSINSVFAKADLVVGRSGINTVTTLLALKKKAILIPLAVGQKNEQLRNAQLMEAEELATIIPQAMLSPKILFQKITDMLSNKKQPPSKWGIPIPTNGADNLVKEVLACAMLIKEK